jgi:hypothetical protein
MLFCERNGEALHEVKGSAFRERDRSETTRDRMRTSGARRCG